MYSFIFFFSLTKLIWYFFAGHLEYQKLFYYFSVTPYRVSLIPLLVMVTKSQISFIRPNVCCVSQRILIILEISLKLLFNYGWLHAITHLWVTRNSFCKWSFIFNNAHAIKQPFVKIQRWIINKSGCHSPTIYWKILQYKSVV